jgi:hypothetical protein
VEDELPDATQKPEVRDFQEDGKIETSLITQVTFSESE